MSIILPRGLPAVDRLRQNGIEVVSPGDARGQGRRALRVVLVNLMPTKVQTEQQIARLLGGAGPHVELTLALPDGYRPRTAPAGHVKRFYRRFGEIRGHRFDAIIVTGAPVENLPFEAVDYWDDLRAIFDWAEGRVGRAYYICWAAQAALKHFHGVEKRSLAAKRFGVFRHRVRQPRSPLFRGFEETFDIPVSRHTEVHRRDLEPGRGLVVLADSPQAGPCLVEDAERRALYMFNHWEYEADTLAAEYERDRAAGKKIAPPVGYPAGGERPRPPVNNWSEPARLFFRNWLALARADAGCMSARAAA
jgi:homoserine O-succinyltransferase